jgi:hypothetical protein
MGVYATGKVAEPGREPLVMMPLTRIAASLMDESLFLGLQGRQIRPTVLNTP